LSVPSRAYEVYGIQCVVPQGYTSTAYNVNGTITAATYPSVWDGTFGARKWTDNPAWIFYDLVTNKRYGLGRYVRPEWLDKWTLYQIAQYCDEMVDDGSGNGTTEPRFTCNVAITQPQDAYSLLNNLVSVFRGMLYWANGRIFPVGPETRDPVFNFTNANVVGGTFSYADTPRNTRSTVCVIKWVDPDNHYRTTPERIEDTDGIARFGYIEKQITAFATTSRGQAIRAAKWLLTVEQLLTETISFQTDLEGLYLRPGDVFNVYDNYRNNQQQGGKVAGIDTTFAARDTITLDRSVTLEAGFTYYMAALVPAANYATGQNITGSSQVGLIRNSQIETRQVLTTAGTVSSVVVSGGFSANLFRGSTWILNGSGTSVTVFDQATPYRCLVASEPQAGVVDILAVQYNTGINYLVNNNYSTEVSPPIVGDTTPPSPPTGLRAAPVTGLLNDNTFYRYAYVYWTPSTSVNVASYDVSGRLNAGAWFALGQVQSPATGINYIPDLPGLYTFKAAAFNANGYGSAYTSGTYTEPATNPLGNTAPLSGIIIAQNSDPYTFSTALNRATGYISTQPVFQWDVALDGIDDSLETPTAQFITGYRARIISVTGGEWNLLSNPIILEGKENTSLSWNDTFLRTGASIKSLRAFTLAVDTMDEYGNIVSGGRLVVNNPQLRPPVASGFVGYNGGVSYNITPPRAADISGVFLWTNASPSFTPTFDNATLYTTNLAGFVNGPNVGNVYTWFSLVDTYGPSGSILAEGDYNARIYGPVSGNANQIAGDLFIDITSQLSGAFNYLTGSITNYTNILSGIDNQIILSVFGLSGSITGAGSINTALIATINQTNVSSSGAIATQINALSARVTTSGQTLGAQIGSVSTALATTGGALSQYTQSLQAYASGATSQVTIAAQAFVTGQVNGFGGVAIARYGFKLDANGKVVSMEATASSFPNSYGTIVFGNADLQSDTFTAGSAGWRIRADGNAEFNNASVRGAFTGGAGSNLAAIDTRGLTVGTSSFFTQIAGADGFLRLATPTTNSVTLASINNGGTYGGVVTCYSDAAPAIPKVQLDGYDGSIFCDILDVNGVSSFDDTATFNASTAIDCGSNSIKVGGGNGNNAGIIYNNGNRISFVWNGSNVKVYVDGTVQGTIPNP
jgi:hypothetical protein